MNQGFVNAMLIRDKMKMIETFPVAPPRHANHADEHRKAVHEKSHLYSTVNISPHIGWRSSSLPSVGAEILTTSSIWEDNHTSIYRSSIKKINDLAAVHAKQKNYLHQITSTCQVAIKNLAQRHQWEHAHLTMQHKSELTNIMTIFKDRIQMIDEMEDKIEKLDGKTAKMQEIISGKDAIIEEFKKASSGENRASLQLEETIKIMQDKAHALEATHKEEIKKLRMAMDQQEKKFMAVLRKTMSLMENSLMTAPGSDEGGLVNHNNNQIDTFVMSEIASITHDRKAMFNEGGDHGGSEFRDSPVTVRMATPRSHGGGDGDFKSGSTIDSFNPEEQVKQIQFQSRTSSFHRPVPVPVPVSSGVSSPPSSSSFSNPTATTAAHTSHLEYKIHQLQEELGHAKTQLLKQKAENLAAGDKLSSREKELLDSIDSLKATHTSEVKVLNAAILKMKNEIRLRTKAESIFDEDDEIVETTKKGSSKRGSSAKAFARVQQHKKIIRDLQNIAKAMDQQAQENYNALQTKYNTLLDSVDVLLKNSQDVYKCINNIAYLTKDLQGLMKPDLTCKYCFSILVNPTICNPCGHVYCSACITKMVIPNEEGYWCDSCDTQVVGQQRDLTLQTICSKYETWNMPLDSIFSAIENIRTNQASVNTRVEEELEFFKLSTQVEAEILNDAELQKRVQDVYSEAANFLESKEEDSTNVVSNTGAAESSTSASTAFLDEEAEKKVKEIRTRTRKHSIFAAVRIKDPRRESTFNAG